MSKSIKNYLTEETVIVKFLPDTKNGITDPKHPLYGGLSSNASIGIPAPLMTGRLKDIFSEDELKFLGEKLNEDLSPNSKFWREYAKDDLGMNTGIFPIFLKKEGMLLQKSNPVDYIKIKILEDNPMVAPSEAEIKNKRSEYRFVLIKQNEQHKEDIKKISHKKEAVKLHTKYEDNPKVLSHILRTFNKTATEKHSLEFLQNETWKIVESDPKLFVNAVSDEFLEEKILIYDLLKARLINSSNRLYFTESGDKLALDKEKNDLDGAAKFLASGVGQDLRLELEAKLKLKDD